MLVPRVMREAPIDDEPETDEKRAAVAEAEADIAVGRVAEHAKIRRRSVSEMVGGLFWANRGDI